MIISITKKGLIFVLNIVVAYYITKALDVYSGKLTSGGNWFYSLIFKIGNLKISLFALLISALLIFFIYKIIYIIFLRLKNFRIIKAIYGTDNKHINITKRLNDCIVDNKLDIQLTNSIAGKDPVYGVKKYAKIKYKNGSKKVDIKVNERENIQIP